MAVFGNPTAGVGGVGGAIQVGWVIGTGWGTYSTDPTKVREFSSANDKDATPPFFFSPHDRWFTSPDAPDAA